MADPPPTTRVTRGTVARQMQEETAGNSFGGDGDQMDHSGMADPNLDSSYSSSNQGGNVFRAPAGRGRKRRSDETAEQATFAQPAKRGRGGRGGGGGRGRGRRATTTVGGGLDDIADESSLFSMVKSGSKKLSVMIDEWIEEYDRHPDSALVQLQQLFISASGCKGVISSNMIQHMEYSEIIRRMTEEFDEESGDYPLVMPGPQWKKFRQNFSDFIQLLVEKCKQSIVFDQKMMDSVIQLLTGLADSQVRAFRHTATFAALKLSSALVDVVLELVRQKEQNARQVETEKAKTQKQRGGNERLEVLITNKQEIEEKAVDVRQMLQYIFKSVFVHRYRDVLPDIRSICIHELGNWMYIYPQHFLEDSFLKYIGWSLYDKIPDVRVKCLSALLPLFEREEVYNKLELFTNKFKERLVSMVNDKETDVAIKACQLITNIYRCFPDLLTIKDCVPIYELVYCNNRGLAVAAGDFLNTKVFQTDAGGRVQKRKSKKDSINAPLIVDLIQFFIESECHDHAAYLVDALIDSNPMIKDWQCMAELLLEHEELGDQSESRLIEVMVCAAKQAATGEPPVGRIAPKKQLNAKDQRQMLDDRNRLTEQFIPVLPALLQKYIADRDKIANLLQIPLLFELELYLAGRLDKHLDELVKMLMTIIEKHTDDEVLEPVAAIFELFTRNVGVNQHTETARLTLLAGLALQLKQHAQRFHDEDHLDEEDEAALLASFRKMAAFASSHDLHHLDLWEVFLGVLAPADGSKVASRDVREKALLCCFLALTWQLDRIVNDQEPDRQSAVDMLRKRRDSFIGAVTGILAEMASGCETALLTLCDTLLLFSWKLGEKDEDLEALVCHVDDDLENRITQFVVDNVFGDSDNDLEKTFDQQQQIELMHKRRNLLAQFCKLIIYGVFSIQVSANVLQYYTKFYTDFGDILKYCLSKCREMDKIQCSRAVVTALSNHFDGLKTASEDRNVDPVSDEFNALRELAKRFALTFGADPLKNREAVATVHREGIVFALEANQEDGRPTNVSFLEVLIEFSNKLMRQDKLAVMRYLDKHAKVPTAAMGDDPMWQPYLLYRSSLQDKAADDVASVRSFTTRGRGRGRGRGRATPTPSESDD